jgi:2-methylcitrate dehydratase PrpD
MGKFLAEAIAEFSAGLRYDAIPEAVRDAAVLHIVDTIGVCVAGARPSEESGRAAQALAKTWGGGSSDATLFGVGGRARADLAALLNGSLAQALEMDDKHGSSLARPGSTVTPAVLAAGEARGASLAEMVTAVTAGYEVMIRLGFVGGDRFLARGYHTSSLLGPFGSAAAIGNLSGAAPGRIVDALGISGTFASGIQESTRTGSTSKILHGGWGAHAGMLAVDLAQAGITGPESVFEGKFGFFQTHLTPIEGELDFPTGGGGFGTKWYLPDTAFKPYPCCQLLHAFIEAAKTILKQLKADGRAVDEVTAVNCKLAEPGLTLVTEPRDRKKRPQTPHEGRFSLPFGVASALIFGDVGLETFSEDRLRDERILKLAVRIEAEEDPDSDYPAHCPAVLDVVAGGKTYHCHVSYHPGCPEAPLLTGDVLDKFERNTRWFFGSHAREAGQSLLDTPRDVSFGDIVASVFEASARAAE